MEHIEPSETQLDYQGLKEFLIKSTDTLKICTAIQALTIRVQVTLNPKKTIRSTFKDSDLLGCESESD